MSHKFSNQSTTETSPAYSPTPRELKALKKEEPPGFLLEVAWVTITLFFVKLSVDGAYQALSFVTVLLPLMVYFIVNVLQNLLKFVQLLHTEDLDEGAGILSPN